MTKAGDRRDAAARDAWQAMAALVLDNQRRREVSDAVGLSFGKVRALRRIASRPMSMRELAALLGIDPPNLTTLVDDLERSGLVERQPHPTDRRVKLVVATSDGAARAQQAEEILERPPAGLFELPADELETLVRILTRVGPAPRQGQAATTRPSRRESPSP
jgi:DNA-binding MarR family transcriptional regulator